MDIILLLMILFIGLLLTNRRELGFLKQPIYIFLGVVSLAWWVFLVIDQLRTVLVCTPGDELCNSGNTFWGDLTWGSMLAFFNLAAVWVPIILIGLHLQQKNTPAIDYKKLPPAYNLKHERYTTS